MQHLMQAARLVLTTAFLVLGAHQGLAQSDPLPSWNDGAAKKSILDFVARTTTQGGADFVPVDRRIATFDNDGTLWSEQPVYFQIAFAFDRIKALAPQHPEWKTKEPFKTILSGDRAALAKLGEKGLLQVVAATHTGMSVEEFEKLVQDWLETARHPRFNRPYTDLVYQPMLELLAYMRANSFKTYIVSGGGIEFMRPWTEKTYGIPPEQVVGSSGITKYEFDKAGKPRLMKLPKVEFIDDGPGKPVGINRFIGRRPYLRVRQLGRRPADAGMDRGRRPRPSHGARPPRRRRTRMGLRPQVSRWPAGQGLGRGGQTRLDRRQHEERLEGDLPIRQALRSVKASADSRRVSEP